MDLSKSSLDVGVYTDRYQELRAFYVDRLGLPYEELLKAGRGIHQHRVGLPSPGPGAGSVLKLNSSREPLDDTPTAFRWFGLHGAPEAALDDPDGNRVRRSPAIDGIAVGWASSDPERLASLLRDGFDAEPVAPDRVLVGTTAIVLEPGGGPVGPLRSRGIRYLTVQVRDVRAEHARLLDLGWREGTAPVKLGETAFISFVLDPDGAPVEISQRASLTGPLPDA